MGAKSAASHSRSNADDNSTEHTALLATPHQPNYTGSRALTRDQYETDEDDEIDANESDLLLARTASIQSGTGLAPESLESDEPGGYLTDDDVEAVIPAALHKSGREFLIDTDYRKFWTIFMGMMLTYFIAAFDGTIMASSHPVITSYFHSSNSASWLSTAFLLTSTAFQPILGRLSDTIGRKGPYIMTMTIFAAATAWCGLAGSMTSFIAARAVCGLGAGGMMTLGSIMISDLVDIERRGTYQSWINAVYGIASASGAALGGLMADTLGWRWEFGIQVPPVILCIILAVIFVPTDLGIQGKRESFMEAMRAFDFQGSFLLTCSTTFLILGLNLGGNILPWSHPFIIASLAISATCFPLCLWTESKAKRPIMPLKLLHSSPRANLIFANFLASLLLNAILFNVPLYFQAVLLTSATESGIRLVAPQVSASMVGTATGFLISRTKRLKWPLTSGTLLSLLGAVVLSMMRRDWPVWAYLLCLLPGAMGQGFQFPGTFIAVLAVSPQAEQAVVTSTLVLWRALGSVLGIACSSLILQNALLAYLRAYVTEDGDGGRGPAWKEDIIERVRGSVEAVARLEGPVREQVVLSYEAAIRVTFLCCVGVGIVMVCLVLPIRLPRLGARK
ncbi:hypothetical protein JX265_000149 [Neoarthrinium moseri]|uniref:Major facilitator superfamily (MFS) profile domain-containing protein n=1 Tax=Neoarthrinium moseri TaxID=1658444 RepID=A0A9Q0ARZ8_9PEZI|nr:hypothetical protein JX265_000149 [Neoarthrinium moseri]